jgi:lipopolysaccharide transport system permease protein
MAFEAKGFNLMLAMLSAAWRYRFFILSSIKTDLRVRFSRSRLGALWIILQPLAQVIIFAFVLSAVLSAKLPGIDNKHAYAIYLMAGILGWSLFADIFTRCLNLFVENANLLKKLAFPRIALPLIATGSAVLNNTMLLMAVVVIFASLGHVPGVALVWLPVVIAVNLALALGLGLALGVINVFVRDLSQVTPVAMQFLFWLTPIVYMPAILPRELQAYLTLNPLSPIIHSYQEILLYNRAPEWAGLGMVASIAVASLLLALVLFRKATPEMVDVL